METNRAAGADMLEVPEPNDLRPPPGHTEWRKKTQYVVAQETRDLPDHQLHFVTGELDGFCESDSSYVELG